MDQHSLDHSDIPPHYIDFLISICSGGAIPTFPPKFNPRLVPLYDELWANSLDRFDGLQDRLESKYLIDNSKLFGGFVYPNSPTLIAVTGVEGASINLAMAGGTYEEYINVIDELSNYWLEVSQSGAYNWRDYLFLVRFSRSSEFSETPFVPQYTDGKGAGLPFTDSDGEYVAGAGVSSSYSRGIFQLGRLANTLIADLAYMKQTLEIAQVSARRNSALINFSQRNYLRFLEEHYTRNPNSILNSGTLPASTDQWGNPGFDPLSSSPPSARPINRNDLPVRSLSTANAFAGVSTSLAWLNARIYYETADNTPHTLLGTESLSPQQKDELRRLIHDTSDLVDALTEQRLMLRSCLLFAVQGLALEQQSVMALNHIFSQLPSSVTTKSGFVNINSTTAFSDSGDCELYPEIWLESTLLSSGNQFLGSTAPEELYVISVFQELSQDRSRYADALVLSASTSSQLGPHLTRVTSEDDVLFGIKRIAEGSVLTSFSGRIIEPNSSYFPTHVWNDIGHFHSDGGGYSMVFESSGELQQVANFSSLVRMEHRNLASLRVSSITSETLGLYADWNARADTDRKVYLNFTGMDESWEDVCPLEMTDMQLLDAGGHAIIELSYNGTCNNSEKFEPPYFSVIQDNLNLCISDRSQCKNFDLDSRELRGLRFRTPIDRIKEGVDVEFEISFTN